MMLIGISEAICFGSGSILLIIVPDAFGGYSLFVSFVCLSVCLCVCVCLSHLFLAYALTQKLLLWSVTQVWPTTEAY